MWICSLAIQSGILFRLADPDTNQLSVICYLILTGAHSFCSDFFGCLILVNFYRIYMDFERAMWNASIEALPWVKVCVLLHFFS